jgi:soluble lytic murein transglycosylase-like protein
MTSKKTRVAHRSSIALAAMALLVGSVWAQNKLPAAAPFSTSVERCIIPAATYHGVNQYVLRAILRIESGLKPSAVGINDNGSKDVGMGQMNSSHFKELAQYGIAPNQLFDECIATYVAAWHLKKKMKAFGNSWFGIAAYHSATPYFNNRYQILLSNELVRSGVIQGRILPVPPLRGSSGRANPTVSAIRAKPVQLAGHQIEYSPALVLNE